MAFNAFRSLQSVELPGNATTSITQLPANILEVFIPGYSIISKFLFDFFGFDITLVVSASLLAFGLFTASKYLGERAYALFSNHFMSFISIESDDDIYDHVMEWIAGQRISKDSRRLMAKTGRENAWDLQDGVEVEETLDQGKLLNFSNWDAKVPPRFQPHFGTHHFFHRGRLFELKRQKKQMIGAGWSGTVFREDEDIVLTCIGRSTQPIKDLIKEARDSYLDKEKACTVVRRPAPKENRGRGRSVWNKVATRPSRPIETVVLEPTQKDRLLADINEYLHPSTPRWYANRGIPYRRGYLLYGPPGTGKSSFAWAIAGVFGLDIYCISLVEPTLTEEDLGLMFTSLPRRCVVLLEDIDSAGLTKRQEPKDEDDKTKPDDTAAAFGAVITKAIKSAQETSNKPNRTENNQGISLSGLLNAIDGVASHEGRVLIMTTNFPDKLDDALIRPGRIDMKVGFTNASRAQIAELFTRMYSPDAPVKLASEPSKIDRAPSTTKTVLVSSKDDITSSEFPGLTPPHSPHSDKTDFHKTVTALTATTSRPKTPTTTSAIVNPLNTTISPDIKEIAAQFASHLPENTFTPAEIQGFLLTRKKEPLRALEEVKGWRDETLEAKERKKKGVGAEM